MRQFQTFLKLDRRLASILTLLVLGFSKPALAQLDFGNCPIVDGKVVYEEFCQQGIADFLEDSEKETFKKVRNSMQRWQWNNSRKGLVDFITRVRSHPETTCKDQFGGSSFALQCSYTEGGQTKTQVFPWIMSKDLNPYYDKNVTTIEEDYQSQVAAYSNRTFSSGEGSTSNANPNRATAVRTVAMDSAYNNQVAQTSPSRTPQKKGSIFLLSSKTKTVGASEAEDRPAADPALVDATGGKD